MKKRSSLHIILLVLVLIVVLAGAALLLPRFLSPYKHPETSRIFIPDVPTSRKEFIEREGGLTARGDWGYPPFEYLNESGEPEGFNIDIFKRISKIMDLDITIDLGPWDEVRNQLARKEIDLLLGMYRTSERDRTADFTIPHFIATYGVFLPKDSDITSIENIEDKRIIVQRGDLGHDYLLQQEISGNLVVLNNWDEVLPALQAGMGDCAVLGMVQGVRAIEEQTIRNIRVLEQPLLQRPYCIAVQEGDSELLASLNEGLNLLKISGEYEEIYEKWFGVSSYPTFLSNKTLKALLSGILLLSLLLVAGIIWSIMLRRRVDDKTVELKAAMKELREANETKNNFLARVSHELRTPLHGIIGMSRLLEKASLNHEQRHLLGMMQNAARQLNRIISDLLDITHMIGEEGISVHPAAFKLVEISEWLEPLLKNSAEEKGLKFSFTCSGADSLLHSDRERISQIVLNLTENAIRNTETGSVLVELSYTDAQLLIEVSDTGRGIPAEKQKEIFSPFTRIEAVNDPSWSGLGLGLSIVKSITEILRGMIRIESNPGEGTTVRIVLPIPEMSFEPQAENRQEPETAPEQEPVDSESTRSADSIQPEGKLPAGEVLVTEDEAINRLYIENLLRDRGWEFTSSSNGEEALMKASQKPYSLILMDLSMPKLGGLEVTRKIRELEKETNRPRTPIIALTAHAYASTRNECLEAGMDGFISKPFRENEFWKEINRVLNEHTP